MPTLKSFIELISGKGLIEDYGELSPYLEPTYRLLGSDLRGTTALFKVRGSELPCVGNVVNTRDKLYRAIGALSDEEAYAKVLKVLNGSKESFIEGEFNNYFIKLDTDLGKLPFIKFFKEDGGMYITSSIVIARTPDVEGYNASIHRLMLLDSSRMAIRLVPRHLYRITMLNSELGRDTPIAIVVGVHPSILLAASTSPPYGVFELGLIRELLGSDLRVCRTPKYDLPVPCESGVVMEGIITRELVDEGPFLDLLELYDRVRPQPVVKVNSIYLTALDDRLFHVILPGGMEHKLLMGFPREAAIWDSVRRVVPKVHKVRLTPSSGCWLHAVISIDKNNDGDAKNAILAAFAGHPSLKHVVVVDGDVDPDNLADVEWAIATRVQASEDLIVIRGARGSTLDPSSNDGITDKIGIDATAPLNRSHEYRRPSELRVNAMH